MEDVALVKFFCGKCLEAAAKMSAEGQWMHYDEAEFKQAFGARVKELRQARKLTLMQISAVYGYHVSAWHNVESGKKLSIETVLRIANTFEMTLEELLGGIKRQKGPGYGSKNFRPKSTDSESGGVA